MVPPFQVSRRPSLAFRGLAAFLLAFCLWAMSGPRGHGEFSGEEIAVLRQALAEVVDGPLRYPTATFTAVDDPRELQPVGFAADVEVLRDEIVNLEIDTLADFTLANYLEAILPRGLVLGEQCSCMGLESPCGGCTSVGFSRAGFSADREQALVYVSAGGIGFFVLLEGAGSSWNCVETLGP